jgi:RNase H-like domain found in reverse transcriptase/Reverse transcriptase (RNA-dependent DNA polymerase)
MTNLFYQTLMHPDDIKFTAVTTPLGLYKFVVMPMGGQNAPSTHQHRMSAALCKYIGKICHVYLDDIIIWSQTVEEHEVNVALILQALCDNSLFCSLKKTELFTTSLTFLGHHISAAGISADITKVSRILDWLQPQKASDVWSFLGLVRYISTFLPVLAEHTSHLTPLTTRIAKQHWPGWSPQDQSAFDHIKQLVVSRECLTVIDHDNPGDNKIYVTCDASIHRTGTCLSFGPTWDTARPVTFDSMQYISAQSHYPTHEQELLAIVCALHHWRFDLLGSHFIICSDHRTLKSFMKQPDLSRRQARWSEFLSQYDFTIEYVPGPDNTVADALSHLPSDLPEPIITPDPANDDISDLLTHALLVSPILSIAADTSFLN